MNMNLTENKQKRILIIEDDPDLRESTTDFLSEVGYDVIEANNGMEGIKMALTGTPDLILCDISMPDLDGYDVYKAIQENKSTFLIPFIFLTAKSEKEDIRAGMQLGADDYITKPFDYDELLTSINTRLEKRNRLVRVNLENFSALLNNTVAGVYILQDFKFSFVNNRLSKIFATNPNDIIGKHIAEFMHEEDFKEYESKVRRCIKGIQNSFSMLAKINPVGKEQVTTEISGGITQLNGMPAVMGNLLELSAVKNNEIQQFLLNDTNMLNIDDAITFIMENKTYLSRNERQKILGLLSKGSLEKLEEKNIKFTNRELEVLQLICDGFTNQEIAEKLFISQRTVDSHRANLLAKTNASNTAGLVIFAVKFGLVKI